MTIQDIIKQKPYLAWYVKDSKQLSDESVLEHVLNYGNWKDVQNFIKIKGFKATAELYFLTLKKKRSNYSPEIRFYFQNYFQKHVSSNFN